MLILAQASLYSSYSCVAAVAQRNSLGASAADSTASVMADDDEEVRVSTRKVYARYIDVFYGMSTTVALEQPCVKTN
jgi:hypothetical protein